MSKNAEQAGLIAYPVNNIKVHQGYNGDFVDYDKNKNKRELFVEGYEQAEKDFMENAEKWFIVRLPIILDEHNPISVKGIFEDFRKVYEKKRLHEIQQGKTC